ncbi:MAG: hypothetical protein CMN30_24005 [Sandaracinus sp.]|nr:hypothetical protein [Sandaracinus sp.]
MPTAPEGCTVQRNTCGDWSVDCPEPDPGTRSDGGLGDGGVGDTDDDGGGCAAGGPGPSGWPALAIAASLFITRRRR